VCLHNNTLLLIKFFYRKTLKVVFTYLHFASASPSPGSLWTLLEDVHHLRSPGSAPFTKISASIHCEPPPSSTVKSWVRLRVDLSPLTTLGRGVLLLSQCGTIPAGNEARSVRCKRLDTIQNIRIATSSSGTAVSYKLRRCISSSRSGFQ